MSDEILYETKTLVRPVSLFLLISASVLFLCFIGVPIACRVDHRFAIWEIVCTVIYVFIALVMLRYVMKGGAWWLKVTRNTLEWRDPDVGSRNIQRDEIESFATIIWVGGGATFAEGSGENN